MRTIVSATLLVGAAVAAACGTSTGEPVTGTGTGPSTAVDASTPDATQAVQVTPSETFASNVDRSEPDPDAPVDMVVAGFNDTGFTLFDQQPADTNFVFSPMSIFHTVLMARGAADESTASSITDGVALPAGPAADAAWNVIDQQMSASPNATVSLANRVWPDIDTEPDPTWLDLLAAEHGSAVEAIDYAADPDAGRDIINEWVSDQTEALIPDLLPPGFITPATTLVLTDAVYFEAEWQNPFGKYGPVSGEFTLLDGSTEPVELMQDLEGSGIRGEGEGFVAAEIPYRAGDFAMLVIVPDDGRFEEIRDGLDQTFLDDIDSTFTSGPYELLLPKWETNSTLDLIPFLGEIGAAPGSYPGISPGSELSAGVHAADITVDEMGTVAAAATALGFEESGPPQPELTVAADQPFLYVIRHAETGVVLFAGQLVDPT